MNASLSRFVASLAIAAATLGLSSMPSAQAEVVFGNMGQDGSGAISTTFTTFGPLTNPTRGLALGFSTGAGSTDLLVQAVTIGAFATDSGTQPRTVSIFSNSGSVPDSSLFTSASTNVGDDGKYTFSFANAQLAAGQTYWIVPDFSVTWAWAVSGGNAVAAEQNDSGYEYVGMVERNSAGAWNSAFLNYSVSIQAVPEPSTLVLTAAAVGLGCFGAARRRRA
jgi:hypothetical protein